METNAVGGAGPGALTQALAGNKQLGQEQFLKLLITQLTHQDPLSPQEDKAFIAQMAQFSSLEGISNMGNSLSRLHAASLVGKTVDASTMDSGLAVPISGVVKSVSFRADGVHLNVNDKDVLLDRVQGVRQG
jgi:flagellar basal-body rod modification protein FlgD